MNLPTIDQCIEVFARGIAFTRSRSRLYIASRIEDIWLLSEDPQYRGRRRNDEWIIPGSVEPEKLDGLARARKAKAFVVSAVVSSVEEQDKLLTEYRKLGYRLWQMQSLMTRSTSEAPHVTIKAEIRLSYMEAMIEQKATAHRGELIPQYMGKDLSLTRRHTAMVNGRLAGWVQSDTHGAFSWCGSMFVEPEFRRRGFGRALVAAMLREDRAGGIRASVLVATHTGALLYSSIGYQKVGTVLVLTPQKKMSKSRGRW